MNGIVIYKGKYGATRQYAMWLGESLHVKVIPAEEVKEEDVRKAGFVIIGSSMYIGKLQLREWLAANAGWLKDKTVFLYIVCGTPLHETQKLNMIFHTNVPGSLQQCKHFFLPGKLVFKQLNLKDKILMKLGSMLASSRGERIPTADYNRIDREHIMQILSAVFGGITSKSY